LLWLAAGTVPFMLTIPETLPSQVLLNKAKRIRRAKIPGYENVIAPVEATDRSLKTIFSVALTRPWKILFDPISFACAVYLSVVYTLLYMLFSIYPFVFQHMRGWNSGVGQLPLIGTVVGACFGGAYVFYVSAQDKKKILAGHVRRPEDRLIVAMVGGIMFPLSMFGFAWSGNFNEVHWIVPTIFGVILAASILLVFVAYLNYITDSYVASQVMNLAEIQLTIP
jgi:DHA1 family multidrug resistance protein-like MFS transporter